MVASASSNLPLTFLAAGSCSITGSVVTITGAGVCSITASQSGSPDFNAAPDVTRSFTVAKATATLVLGGLAQTYDGAPKSVSVSTSPNVGVVSVTYTGLNVAYPTSSTPPTTAGTYTVAAALTDPNYQGTATASLVISPATATLTLVPSSLNQTWDGSPKSVQVATTPGGLPGVTVTYNGLATPPSAVGPYPVVASLSNPNYLAANATGTLVIQPATPTLTLAGISRSPNPGPQFSDTIDLVATLPVGATGTVAFTFNGVATSPPSATVAADGTARVSVKLDQVGAPSGAIGYGATAAFTAAAGSSFASASTAATVTVQRGGAAGRRPAGWVKPHRQHRDPVRPGRHGAHPLGDALPEPRPGDG